LPIKAPEPGAELGERPGFTNIVDAAAVEGSFHEGDRTIGDIEDSRPRGLRVPAGQGQGQEVLGRKYDEVRARVVQARGAV
jgi:hypothetical protein